MSWISSAYKQLLYGRVVEGPDGEAWVLSDMWQNPLICDCALHRMDMIRRTAARLIGGEYRRHG